MDRDIRRSTVADGTLDEAAEAERARCDQEIEAQNRAGMLWDTLNPAQQEVVLVLLEMSEILGGFEKVRHFVTKVRDAEPVTDGWQSRLAESRKRLQFRFEDEQTCWS